MLFMAAPEQNNPLVTLVMGENHLLMRQIRHMLYHTSHFFMHGAVVEMEMQKRYQKAQAEAAQKSKKTTKEEGKQ